jgi:hypothetical protein
MPPRTSHIAPEVRGAIADLQRQINDIGAKLQAQQELLCALVDTHPNPAAAIERFRDMGQTVVDACRESKVPEAQIAEDEIARFWLARILDPHVTETPCIH